MLKLMERKYINKHLAKAEGELKSIVYPNKKGYFVEIDKLTLESQVGEDSLASFNKKERKLYINTNKICLKNPRKNEFDSIFIEILQHELVHYFCADHLDDYGLNSLMDSSPIFHSVIIFINSRGLNLKTNGNFDELYKKYHKDLYKKASNIEITFDELVIDLNSWMEELKNKVENGYKYSFYWNNKLPSGYRFSESGEEYFQLGMDCNLENYEELINR